MKVLKTLAAIAVLTVAAPAWAQSTSGQTAADIVRDQVFTAVEKRIIGEHYGVNVEDMAKKAGVPDWAVKTAKGEDANKREGDDEEADEDGGNGRGEHGKKDKGEKGHGKKDKGNKGHGNGKSKGLPPGLAKRDTLPPGLQRQLEKNGRLPAGLAKRDLPSDLAAKMPKRDSSQEVDVVGNDVVLVDKATGVILDVLKDVVNGKVPAPDGSTVNPDGSLQAPGPQSSGANGSESDSALGKLIKGIFGGN